MAQFNISVDLGDLKGAKSIVNGQVFPLVKQAVSAIAQQARINWMASVSGASGIWSGEKQRYIDSIKIRATGPFSAVVWTDYRVAEEIETGRPARDLKRMLDTSLKVRATKQGKRYLIIPMRHNIPGNDAHAPAMPPDVYALAQKLKPSRVLGQLQRPSGTGAYGVKSKKLLTVNQNVYAWGDKLTLGDDPAIKNYQGMYRFDTSSGAQKSSTYLTFRVMMEGSKGWIIPSQPGKFIAKKVADQLQPVAEQVLAEAVKQSV